MNSTLKKKKPESAKIRYAKCEMCTTRTEMRLLYTVLDKKMCLSCGQQQIDIWNKAVAEVEGAHV